MSSALVAQGIEHGSPKAGVAGSNPAGGTAGGTSEAIFCPSPLESIVYSSEMVPGPSPWGSVRATPGMPLETTTDLYRSAIRDYRSLQFRSWEGTTGSL
jgi:hypothetical protein